MKYLLALIVCLSLLLTGCVEGQRPAEQQSAEDAFVQPEFKYHHYADPAGEVFAYMTIAESEIDAPSGRTMETGNIVLSSIPTGEKFIEYEVTNGIVIFSPDGEYALKVIPKNNEMGGEYDLALCRTADDSEIWRVVAGGDGEVPPQDIIWDKNRDMLIGVFMKLPEELLGGTADAQPEVDLEALQPTFIRAYRISDGESLGETEMALSMKESVSFTMMSRYNDGKIFAPATGNPFDENRDRGKKNLELFAIEVLTWETELIDTGGLMGEYATRAPFISEDGSRLFFQPGVDDPDNKLTMLGNDIIEIDLNTGEWNTLLEKNEETVYELVGITPDGAKVLCYELSRDAERKMFYRTIVLDVSTGEKTYIEKAKDVKERTTCQISASGRYVIESSFLQDVWLHDLETGDLKLLVKPDEGYIALNYPGIPGQFNSRY